MTGSAALDAPPPSRAAAMLDWILTEGRLLESPTLLLSALCARLTDAGVGLMRSTVQVRTLHPEVGVVVLVWHRPDTRSVRITHGDVVTNASELTTHGEVHAASVRFDAFDGRIFKASPFRVVIEDGTEVRCVIGPEASEQPYPIVEDLRAAGATDYLALPLSSARGPRSGVSFVTDRPGGFSGEAVALLRSLLPALSLCFELHSARHVTASLLRAYLGEEPGRRVREGQVRPGDVRQIEAAILFSDIRDFTSLSATVDAKTLVATLNDYFAAVTGPFEALGGEILKFIGDAMLVVFTVGAERDATAACRAALRAAVDANAALDRWNEERAARGLAPLEHGIGLHMGTAEYGNVGSPTRLDFTVIGRDVNLASRVEGLCGRLGRRLLVSAALATKLPGEPWEDLGRHVLKGVGEPQRVWAPRST